jgi:hypothetical protein
MPGHFDEKNQADGRTQTASNGGQLPSYENFVDAPFFESAVDTQSANLAYKRVLSDVGCSSPMLDDHDHRIIAETLEGTTTYVGSISSLPGLPDSQEDVGGWENYPTTVRDGDWDMDRDGLPKWWEEIHGSNPESPFNDLSDAHADLDRDGYTALEEYLHWIAAPHYQCHQDSSIEIDLAARFRGFTLAPVYSFSGESHCTVAMISGTATARVTAEAAFTGLASVDFTVTDSVGDQFQITVGIRVLAETETQGHKR